MNKTAKAENLFLGKKTRSLKQPLVASLLELIQAMQKEVTAQIMKFVS